MSTSNELGVNRVMHIKNSLLADYGNFELDMSAVGRCSLSSEDIKLPYTGVLPKQMSKASNAYIYFNIQATQEVSVVLVVNAESGRQTKRPLLVSNEEMISLLDDFFKQSWENTGLKQYYLGLWWAHYIDWKKIVTGPDRLLTIMSTLPIQDKKFLKKHIMDDAS